MNRRRTSPRIRVLPGLAGLAVLTACGWAEVPAQPDSTRAPAQPVAPAPATGAPPAATATSSGGAPVEVVDLPPVPTVNQDGEQQAAVTPGGPPPASPADKTIITVRRGDTLYGLARRHGVSAQAIIDANRLRPPYELAAGQRLRLPAAGEPVPAAREQLPRSRKSVPAAPEHEVLRGETLYSIARQHGVEVAALASVNGLVAPYRILPGQRLRLPDAPQPDDHAEGPADTATAADGAPTDATAAPPAPSAMIPAPPVDPGPLRPPPARAGSRFAWPLQGPILSGFGPKSEGLHNDGINIAAQRGTPVRAAENGVVAYAGNDLRGFGNLVLLRHADGWITAYAHADRLAVQRGAVVQRGDVIAYVGSTGGVGEPQLHFQIRRGKQAVDPREHLAKGA